MMVQIWFTENVLPAFTEEDKVQLAPVIENSMIGIGNVVDGRHLIRSLIDDSDYPAIEYYLGLIGKEPILCGVMEQSGARAIDTVTDEAEYRKHFLPYESTDEDGNVIMITPPCNTSSGWATFESMVDSSKKHKPRKSTNTRKK